MKTPENKHEKIKECWANYCGDETFSTQEATHKMRIRTPSLYKSGAQPCLDRTMSESNFFELVPSKRRVQFSSFYQARNVQDILSMAEEVEENESTEGEVAGKAAEDKH